VVPVRLRVPLMTLSMLAAAWALRPMPAAQVRQASVAVVRTHTPIEEPVYSAAETPPLIDCAHESAVGSPYLKSEYRIFLCSSGPPKDLFGPH